MYAYSYKAALIKFSKVVCILLMDNRNLLYKTISMQSAYLSEVVTAVTCVCADGAQHAAAVPALVPVAGVEPLRVGARAATRAGARRGRPRAAAEGGPRR